MIIKLPYMSESFFLYVNPDQVSSFTSGGEKSSYLWLKHDETQYEICLPVDELEQRLTNAMADTRHMNVHADYANMLVQLNYLRDLHEIARQFPYFVTGVIVALMAIAIALIIK
jgi:hypothetical protein